MNQKYLKERDVKETAFGWNKEKSAMSFVTASDFFCFFISCNQPPTHLKNNRKFFTRKSGDTCKKKYWNEKRHGTDIKLVFIFVISYLQKINFTVFLGTFSLGIARMFIVYCLLHLSYCLLFIKGWNEKLIVISVNSVFQINLPFDTKKNFSLFCVDFCVNMLLATNPQFYGAYCPAYCSQR